MGLGTAVRFAAAAVLLAGCSTTVAGSGALAPEALTPVQQAAPPPASATPPPTPTPAPTSTGGPAPRLPTVPAGFAGSWQGPVTQPGSTIPAWTAQLRLTGGRREGVFVIAGYCRGSTAVLASARTRLVLQEVISSDPRNVCAASGTITLTPSGDGRLRFRWVDRDHPDNIATGLLRRG